MRGRLAAVAHGECVGDGGEFGSLAFLQFGARHDDRTPLRSARGPAGQQVADIHEAGQQGLERRKGVIGVPDGVGEGAGEPL